MTDSLPTQLALAGSEKPKTRYTFISTATGCLIQREGGFECSYDYHDTFIHVNGKPYGLYVYKVHLQAVAETFAGWVSVGRSKVDYYECIEMIARALNSRLLGQWKRIVRHLAPPEAEDLSRKMFNSVVGDAAILHFSALYTDEYKHLRSDLAKYAACRMYAKHLEGEEKAEPWEADARKGIVYSRLNPTELLTRAANWRQALTPAVPCKALNKTLDSISWGISWKHLHRLSTMRLVNPITTRLHLAFALAASDHHNWGLHERTVLGASDQAVIEAGAIFGWEVNTRTRKDHLIDLSHRILDYPETYHGDLVGLARRSKDWHDAMRVQDNRRFAERFAEMSRELEPETPLPLPDLDYAGLAERGVTPLRTAGECYEEHRLMRHCVHTYATKARAGECYLFHVECDRKKDDGSIEHSQATVELLPNGEIGQAKGPENENNAACHHGMGVLRWAWGAMVKGQML